LVKKQQMKQQMSPLVGQCKQAGATALGVSKVAKPEQFGAAAAGQQQTISIVSSRL
jgi:hypothetical protein